MITFKEYKSKPIIRRAYELQESDTLVWNSDKNELHVHDLVVACFQKPKAGDFVVYIDESDIYHCAREIFTDINYI